MHDDSAVDDLIRLAGDPAVSSEALHGAVSAAFTTIFPRDRPDAEAVLRRLSEELIDAPTRPNVAGTVALCCGALVERGLDPRIALDPILARLERQVVPDAIRFVDACQQVAEAETPPLGEGAGPEQESSDKRDPVEHYGERIAALMPTEEQSFRALEPFSLAAVAMLSRSAEARKSSWSRTVLRASLDELGGQYGYAGLLWSMLQVLDDEPITVLHPEQGKGYRVRISGLADNFQLHTLLANALIGRFSSRWLRGRRPGRAEVAAAGDGTVQETESRPAHGSFNLWTWRGLKADGTFRDFTSGTAHWIWNEGVPTDIPPFEGTRVVLLGPPPYPRSWTACRKFAHMTGDLRVERILTTDEVRNLLGRITESVPAE